MRVIIDKFSNAIMVPNSTSTMSTLASTSRPTANIFAPSPTAQQLVSFYDPATSLVWVAVDKHTRQPIIYDFASFGYSLASHYYNPQTPPSENPYPATEANGGFNANIDPSLQPIQTKITTLTGDASGHAAVPPIPPSKRTSASSDPPRSSKRRRTSEEVPEAPGLYKKINECSWRCVFRSPNSKRVCGLIRNGRRDLYRHIGTHANKERELIRKGQLLAENAVAIHREVLMKYRCQEEHCQYREDNGVDFTYEGHRIDIEKGRHIKEYHS